MISVKDENPLNKKEERKQQLWTVVRTTTRKLKTDESAYLHCILKETKKDRRFFFSLAAVRVSRRFGSKYYLNRGKERMT